MCVFPWVRAFLFFCVWMGVWVYMNRTVTVFASRIVCLWSVCLCCLVVSMRVWLFVALCHVQMWVILSEYLCGCACVHMCVCVCICFDVLLHYCVFALVCLRDSRHAMLVCVRVSFRMYVTVCFLYADFLLYVYAFFFVCVYVCIFVSSCVVLSCFC